MAGLCALHPPGPARPCRADAPGTPSGGRSSRQARSLAFSPSIASWVAGQGRENDEVKQMSWSSGRVKKEAGNLSHKPRQAKPASATGRGFSAIFSSASNLGNFAQAGKSSLGQPVHKRKWMKRMELCLSKAYIVQGTGLEAVCWGSIMAVNTNQGCPEGLGSRKRHVHKRDHVAIKSNFWGERDWVEFTSCDLWQVT